MERDLRTTTTGPHGPAAPPDEETSVTWDEWRPPPPTVARSVPLADLLTIAALTPAQAVLVTADLLHVTGAAAPERVHPVLRTDGAVDISDMDGDIPSVPLRDLLDEVVRNARRLPSHPQPRQVRLLHHLEEQVASTGDPAERGTALRGAYGGGRPRAVTRTRRELVALVEAFNGIAVSRSTSSVPINGHALAVTPVPRPVSLRPHDRPHAPRQLSRRRRRSRRMLVILGIVALALVVGGYVFLRGPVSDLIDHVRGNSNTAGTNQPAPPPTTGHHHRPAGHTTAHHPSFPTLAPQSNGPVRAVTLQKINGCAPGTTCGVTVTVHLTPAGVSQVVGWRVGVMKNCARPTTWSPVTTVTAQPGWSQVFAPSSVQVPNGRSLALVALTSTPKHAQSQPIPLGGTPLHC